MINNKEEFTYPSLTNEEREEIKNLSNEENGFISKGEQLSFEIQTDLQRKQHADNMTKEETFHFILGAVSGGLMIAGVFVVVFFIFLLFATNVWLK